MRFFQIFLKKSELKTTHNTFRDCRVQFSDNLSQNGCIRVGISLFELYEREGKSVVRKQKAYKTHPGFGCEKENKFGLAIIDIQRTVCLQQLKGKQSPILEV